MHLIILKFITTRVVHDMPFDHIDEEIIFATGWQFMV